MSVALEKLMDLERENKTLRARVTELEARIAELQPMAECAAIMAVCGYFSRMRGPDFYAYQFPTCVRFSADTYNGSRPLHAIPLYAGSAPVPAVQAEAKVEDETPESVIAAYKAGLTHGREQPDYEFEFASGSASDTAYAIGYNEGYEQRLASATVPPAEAKVGAK